MHGNQQAVQPTAGPVEVLVGGVATIPRVGLGFALGAGFDAAGQYAISYAQTGVGSIRPEQSLFAGLTGGIALPLTTGRGLLTGVIGGGATGAANTNFNNWMYGENTSAWLAFGIGGIAGGLGTYVGSAATNRFVFTPTIRPFGDTPNFPASPSPLAPYAPQVGNSLSNTLGGIPAFIPFDSNTKEELKK